MAFTYDGNPAASERDAVRFLVGDTDPTEPLLGDAEIEWVITTWEAKGHVYFYASVCAEIIAARFARETTISADGQTVSMSELQEKYLRLAQTLNSQYEQLLASGVGIHAGGMSAGEHRDGDLLPLAFGTQMHDNHRAGWQDYGDRPSTAREHGQWGEFTP